jgi:biotin-[acetyl-CoA-carboxylase] ligase BirA-like protein
MNLNRLQGVLRTRRFGKCILFEREVGSTNDWAKDLAKLGAEEGLVTVAERQTAGRGRLGRKWVSPRGGLWFSVVVRPRANARDAVKLVFVAGLAVAKVLHLKYGLRVETKWPNDVLANGKKICGILAEMSTRGKDVNYAVVGVGLNANFSSSKMLKQSTEATSILDELGKSVSLEDLLASLLEELENAYELYAQSHFGSVLEAWKKYASFLGKRVEVISRNERFDGVATDVDSDGALVLRLEDGTTQHIFSGDVLFCKV